MSVTVPEPQTRFIRRGISKTFWVPSIADLAAMTRAELTAGTDLSNFIAAVNGFSESADNVDTPDMGHRFTSSIPGPTSVGDSSLAFYEDQVSAALESLLPINATGFVVILPKGDVAAPAGVYSAFPVRVSSQAPDYGLDNNAAQFTVSFSVTDEPVLNKPLPTGA